MEVCCGSADDVIEAWKGGANRVELNSNLFQGGLTPTVGCLQVVKQHVNIPVMTMVRPRAGGFCYTDIEYLTMKAVARALLENVQRVVRLTGCDQIHLARHKSMPDPSRNNNRSIYFGGMLFPPEDRYDVTDGAYIAGVRARIC